jgi:hypothetical protein
MRYTMVAAIAAALACLPPVVDARGSSGHSEIQSSIHAGHHASSSPRVPRMGAVINPSFGQPRRELSHGTSRGLVHEPVNKSMLRGSDRSVIGIGTWFGDWTPVGIPVAVFNFEPTAPETSSEPEILRQRAAPERSRPAVIVVVDDHKPAVALKSKELNNAEQFAKANGCPAPMAKMNFAVVGVDNFETFSVACGGEKRMMIRCDAGQCLAMQ